MASIKNKISSSYSYKPTAKGSQGLVVAFYTETRVDKYGNPLKRINTLNKFGEIESIEYFGKDLHVSISTSKFTTVTRRATREDLLRYKDAYADYLENISIEEREEIEENLPAFLSEKFELKQKPKQKIKQKPSNETKIINKPETSANLEDLTGEGLNL